MANPQKEDGFTSIANEIMDRLSLLNLSSSEWKMMMVLFRQTYGWNKKTDVISLSQFEKKTGMDRTTVCRMKKRLVAKRLLLIKEKGLMFNKNYDEWVVAKQPVAKRSRPSGETVNLGSGETLNQVVAKQPHTKDTIQNTLITKDTNTKAAASHESAETDNEINKVFSAFYEFNKGINFGNKTSREACVWLIRQYGLEKVINVVKFIAKIRGRPYAPRISTPYQLKEKWADLETFALTEKEKQETKKFTIGSITPSV